jgi:predicted PurR-regulated permease PerM
MTIRGRLHRRGGDRDEGGGDEEFIELEPGALSGVFAAPRWLRDLGFSSWLLVGVAAAIAGLVWLLALTQTIVLPVITAAIVGSVASPVVDWLQRHRVPRAAGAAMVFLTIVLIGVGITLLILGGVASQAEELTSQLRSAADNIEGWLKDAGVSASSAQHAKDGASSALSGVFDAVLHGVVAGIGTVASVAVFVTFAALSLFFILKDAPTLGAWIERHMGVPEPVAKTITKRTAGSLRGYFAGVTLVAAYSATIVGIAALIIGVPLAGSIAVVTFIGGYIPYLGAWAAGVFAVLIALGSDGASAALAMAIVVLLANGILQQLIQPFAYGTALGIHPLAVLIVTIAGGAMFGTIGLVLAAPLVAAATKISADLSRAREEDAAEGGEGEPAPPPGDAGPDPAPAPA